MWVSMVKAILKNLFDDNSSSIFSNLFTADACLLDGINICDLMPCNSSITRTRLVV